MNVINVTYTYVAVRLSQFVLVPGSQLYLMITINIPVT